MKNIYILLLLAMCFSLTGCDDDRVVIDGKTYNSYGIFNKNEEKNPNLKYETNGENVLLAIVFSETIIIPIYVIGWDLYKPVGLSRCYSEPGQAEPDKNCNQFKD